MRPIFFFGLLFLGFLSVTSASCKSVEQTQAGPRAASSCRQANETMVALENGHSSAINKSVNLMSCYDGAYAERVDAALGMALASAPRKVLAAFHANHVDTALIQSIARTQPWSLVDEPCKFAAELEKRQAAIENVNQYPAESRAVADSIRQFLPTVSGDCENN